ncbi:MAG: DUF3526 domain-containing protein [Ottowia sp.]|uniref:DUF3526 domain-containing protein n=1 Tax=unclassified Ottowia TaxID=2645081 RepID=UPI003C2AEE20
MIGLVLKKELNAFWRDGRLLLLGLSLLCVFMGVMAASASAAAKAQAERDAVGATARAQWDQQGVKHPHRAAHFGIYVFKPMLALAAVDPGINAQVGQSLWLEPHKRNLARNAPAVDDPPSARLGEAAPAFVLLVLMPLLIIGLGHNAVTQERESGTLRMLHAAGVRTGALLLGKWLALMLVIGFLLLPAGVAGAWLLVPAGGWNEGADGVVRIALYGAGLFTYFAILAALAIAVSARARTSRGALLVLLGAWIVFAWLAPRLGAAAAQTWRPVPSGEAFSAAVARDIQQGLPGDGDAAGRLSAFENQLLKEHGVARLEDLPLGANAARRIFRDAYATRVYAMHFSKLWDEYAVQQNVVRAAGLFSPLVPMRGLSAAMAGTDLAHQRHYEEAAEAYREYFTVQIDEWDKSARSGLVSAEDKYADDAQWQAVAPFRYQIPKASFALVQAAPDVLILLAWLVAAAAAVGWAARKVEP